MSYPGYATVKWYWYFLKGNTPYHIGTCNDITWPYNSQELVGMMVCIEENRCVLYILNISYLGTGFSILLSPLLGSLICPILDINFITLLCILQGKLSNYRWVGTITRPRPQRKINRRQTFLLIGCHNPVMQFSRKLSYNRWAGIITHPRPQQKSTLYKLFCLLGVITLLCILQGTLSNNRWAGTISRPRPQRKSTWVK